MAGDVDGMVRSKGRPPTDPSNQQSRKATTTYLFQPSHQRTGGEDVEGDTYMHHVMMAPQRDNKNQGPLGQNTRLLARRGHDEEANKVTPQASSHGQGDQLHPVESNTGLPDQERGLGDV